MTASRKFFSGSHITGILSKYSPSCTPCSCSCCPPLQEVVTDHFFFFVRFFLELQMTAVQTNRAPMHCVLLGWLELKCMYCSVCVGFLVYRVARTSPHPCFLAPHKLLLNKKNIVVFTFYGDLNRPLNRIRCARKLSS